MHATNYGRHVNCICSTCTSTALPRPARTPGALILFAGSNEPTAEKTIVATRTGATMELIAGAVNKRWLQNLAAHHTPECTEVLAAVAYASADNLDLFDACKRHSKPMTYYGRKR